MIPRLINICRGIIAEKKMKIKPEYLNELSDSRLQNILNRSMEDISEIYSQVRDIVIDVRDRGDIVSIEHYRKYKDDITADDLVVSRKEVDEAYEKTESEIIDNLKLAALNIEKFHKAQLDNKILMLEVMDGILAGRVTRPMDIIGAYVPGREAIYPSSVLMTIIPAKVAGVENIVACTPPNRGMVANEITIVAADIAGADKIFKIGGPWAIASMAFGTETVPRTHKIVGPGGSYVTAAKMAVFGHVDIDSPAGPSEVLILADESADPQLMAIDLLAQGEHTTPGSNAAAVMITTSPELAEQTCEFLAKELKELPNEEVVEKSLEAHSAVLIAEDFEQALEFTNEYASEHLEVVVKDPFSILSKIKHAGSIFLGENAPVPVGDYASGTNHVLPTGQCAKMFSGLSVDDFIKKPTFQYLTPKGLQMIGDTVITLAEKEGFYMHAKSVKERMKRIS